MELTSLTRIEQGEISHLGSHQLRPGAGPRHLEFNEHTTVLYICGELDNTEAAPQWVQDLSQTCHLGQHHWARYPDLHNLRPLTAVVKESQCLY